MSSRAKKVLTPGSQKEGSSSQKKKRVGGRPPSLPIKKRRKLNFKHREAYTEDDVIEGVRLVREEEYCIKAAALFLNSKKVNVVPRMTLSDRLSRPAPEIRPPLGRPITLSPAVEKALVKCLILCAEFQYPMRKRDLQDLVQAYCLEHDVLTSWEDKRPGKAWIRKFTRRWQHLVKVRKPTHIKRSRAKVSPAVIREFFTHLAPNMEGVPATHIFNYDETNLRDDPMAEEAFFGGGTKYFEQVRNTSKIAFSVMFCCSAAGDLLPPMTVYKSGSGVIYKSWCENGPVGAAYAATKSGWFDMSKFNQWFTDVSSNFLLTNL